MSRRSAILIASFTVVTLFVSACGGNQSQSIPSPTAPQPSAGGSIPTFTSSTSSLPSLPNAAELLLDNTTTYQGLSDVMAPDVFFPPLVISKVQLDITGGRSSTPGGTNYILVEDKQGGWVAQIPVFTGATSQTSTSLDMIFADDVLVTRAIATIGSNDSLVGSLYYRVRASGDNQCKARPDAPQLDVITPCRDIYMDISSSGVKRLGTFRATYSSWLK